MYVPLSRMMICQEASSLLIPQLIPRPHPQPRQQPHPWPMQPTQPCHRKTPIRPASAIPALAELPLYEQSLSWVIPTAIALVICLFVDHRNGLPAPEPGESTASIGAKGARAANVHA